MNLIPYVKLLKEGQTVKFRGHGNSMQGRIESGQLITVEPIGDREIRVGDILLCKVDGRLWVHLCTAIGSDGRYQISNNKGHVNGWCKPNNAFGIVIKVET